MIWKFVNFFPKNRDTLIMRVAFLHFHCYGEHKELLRISQFIFKHVPSQNFILRSQMKFMFMKCMNWFSKSLSFKVQSLNHLHNELLRGYSSGLGPTQRRQRSFHFIFKDLLGFWPSNKKPQKSSLPFT